MSKEAAALRVELRGRAIAYARARGLVVGHDFYESLGRENPVVLFRDTNTGHGNFIPESLAAIRQNKTWHDRTRKPHSQLNSLPIDHRATALEMDSSNSSDALLMNIFCYPGVGTDRLCGLLGIERWITPTFGRRFCVPGEDAIWSTELDMCMDNELSVEAKLTEQSFTSKSTDSVEKYEDLGHVFDIHALPRKGENFESYQLIRNVLAAHARNGRFLLFVDRRRPDLRALWTAVHKAVALPGLAARCAAVEWQAIAAVVPDALRSFLGQKYGIVP